MKLKFFCRKFVEYSHEIGVCLKVGAGIIAPLQLAANTLRYHVAKVRGRVRLGRSVEYPICAILPAKKIKLRSVSGDLMIFHEVFTNQVYALPETMLNNVRSVVDLGANIGMATLYFAGRFPAARFVCVEPLPSNYNLLEFNLQGMTDRALLFQAAVSNSSGQFDFEDTGNTYGCHLAAIDNKNYLTKQTIKVNCLEMNELLKKAGMDTVDLLKIDIEGAEEALLAGSPEWLKRVSAIVIEIHAGYTYEKLQADLSPQGFVLTPLGDSVPPKTIFARRQA